MADAVGAMHFATEFQVNQGWPGVIAAWVTIYSHVLIRKKFRTHVGRVAIVGLFRASRVFLRVFRFSSIRKIIT